MSGFVYLIRNKDLYKIGITQNLEQRMKALKPDEILKTVQTEDYEELEKELHKKYKDVRVPQTEYFRLTPSQLADCKSSLKGNFFTSSNQVVNGTGGTSNDIFSLLFTAFFILWVPIFFIGGFYDLFSTGNWQTIYKWPAIYWSAFCGFGCFLFGIGSIGSLFGGVSKEQDAALILLMTSVIGLSQWLCFLDSWTSPFD